MNKKKIHVFGKDYYLLGVDKYGVKHYLEEFTFDCGWYYGGGYVETFTNNKNPERSRDISMHTHFDGLFFNGKKSAYDLFKEYFTETPLNEDETWKLLELIKSFYTIREYSDLLYRGGAHYTRNPIAEDIKNEAEYKRINEEVIPKLAQEIYKLLEG